MTAEQCPVDDDSTKRSWCRHPVIAITVGLAVTGAMANVLLGYGPGFGPLLVYAIFAVPVSLIAGFLVGLISGRDGAKWAGITSGLFVLVIAVYFSLRMPGLPLTLMISILLGVPPTIVAAVGGRLAGCVSGCPARTEGLLAIAIIMIIFALQGGFWFSQKMEVAQFRKNVLPVIQANLAREVMRLPPGTQWDIERRSNLADGRFFWLMGEGPRFNMNFAVLSRGTGIRHFHSEYTPTKKVALTSLPSARAYLKEVGFADKVITRMETDDGSFTSWFCSNALLPDPTLAPYDPRSGLCRDVSIMLAPDGSIIMYGR